MGKIFTLSVISGAAPLIRILSSEGSPMKLPSNSIESLISGRGVGRLLDRRRGSVHSVGAPAVSHVSSMAASGASLFTLTG